MQGILLTALLVLCCLITNAGKISVTACITNERDSLVAFKAGFGDQLRFWQGQNCCAWSGVSCSKNNIARVVSLDIGHYDLTFRGEINSSLAALTHLVYLNLSGNDFGGVAIPDFIGSFKKLRYLDLSHAGFGGTVPQLGNLSMLSHLDLSSPSHTLTVKSFNWVSHLTSLIYLDLSWLYLAASSDWLQATNTLPFLEVLRLNDAFLPATDFNAISHTNFTAIRVLDLKSNNFSSRMPDWISKLSSLAYLDILEHMKALELLDMSSNQLEGCIPDLPPSVKVLDLSSNHQEEFGNLRSLEVLDLSRNDLSGQILQSFLSMSGLSHLNLSYNDLSGAIPFGNRLATFAESTYLGNANLCGPPLPRSCLYHKRKHQPYFDMGTYLSALLGFAFGFNIVSVILISNMVA